MSEPPRSEPLPAGVVAATLTSAYAETYRRFPDRPAIVADRETVLTYGQLGEQARRVAGGLAALGLAPGDRVVVLCRNRVESFLLDHALAAGGFVRVALSFRLNPREVAHIALDCGARAAFVDGEHLDAAVAEFAAASCPAEVIGLDRPGPSGRHLDDLRAALPLAAPPAVAPEDLAWLPYTSGTTGEPKGVMLSHRSLLASARNLLVELPAVGPDDLVLHVAPVSHLSGYVAMTTYLRGAAQTGLADFTPESALEAIAARGATIVPCVPTMLTMLLPLLEAEPGRWDLDRLHTVLYAGSAIAPDRLARLVRSMGNVFVQAYGLSEVPFPLAALSRDDHAYDPTGPPPERLASAGRVSPFVQLRLRSPDGTATPDGQPGEIQVRGDMAMLGYWNRPDATAETIRPGGWIATGDVGRLTDGYLYIVDRKKDMIVSGGFNIFPAEVENAILALPAVAEAAVVGVPDPRWGEAVKAFVVIQDGCTVTSDDVDRACRERIASYKRPRAVEFVASLPKTGSGKIQRHELRSRHWDSLRRKVGG